MVRMVLWVLAGVFVPVCVASAALVDKGGETLSDPQTGLMWQKASASGTTTWQQALAYAEGLSLEGYDDWRLPSRNELLTLVDFTCFDPAVDPVLAPHTESWGYWTSTTYMGLPYRQLAYTVDFLGGSVSAAYKTLSSHVRAVRSLEPNLNRLSVFLEYGNPPLDAGFTAEVFGGEKPYVYDVDFGDGSTHRSSDHEFTHTYNDAGIYSVACTVTDSSGSTTSKTMNLAVTLDPDIIEEKQFNKRYPGTISPPSQTTRWYKILVPQNTEGTIHIDIENQYGTASEFQLFDHDTTSEVTGFNIEPNQTHKIADIHVTSGYYYLRFSDNGSLRDTKNYFYFCVYASFEVPVKIEGVPDYHQEDYTYVKRTGQCAPTAGACILGYWANQGYPLLLASGVTELITDLEMNSAYDWDDGGTFSHTMDQAMELVCNEGAPYGFRTVYLSPPSFSDCKEEIDRGRPFYISVHDLDPYKAHAVTAIGYDETNGNQRLIVHDNWKSTEKEIILDWNPKYFSSIIRVLPGQKSDKIISGSITNSDGIGLPNINVGFFRWDYNANWDRGEIEPCNYEKAWIEEGSVTTDSKGYYQYTTYFSWMGKAVISGFDSDFVIPNRYHSSTDWSDALCNTNRDTDLISDIDHWHFEITQTCTVSFRDADGTPLKSEAVSYGGRATAPDDPVREGHTFTGWDRPLGPITKDLDVKALYKVRPYTLSFDPAGGSAVQAITQDYGTALTAPDDPTREGYDFAGWDPPFPATMPAEDRTLRAQWSPQTCTLSYTAAGNGTVIGEANQTIPYGGDGSAVQAVPDEDHRFVRWSDGSTQNPRADREVTVDVTVFAIFHMPADVNGDGLLGLPDVTLALQVVAAVPLSGPVSPNADVDGDGRIGLAEAVYAIQGFSETAR